MLLILVLIVGCLLVGEFATRWWLSRTSNQTAILCNWYPYIEFLVTRGKTPRIFEFADADALGRISPSAGSPRVWFFGGSTVEGEYENWLPVEFAKRCLESGRPCSVKNWGQSAYQIHQEKYLFMELLRSQPPPDIAIFYDGVNEIDNNKTKQVFSAATTVNLGLFHSQPNEHSLVRRLSRRTVKSVAMLQSLLNHRPIPIYGMEMAGLPWEKSERFSTVLENYVFNVRVVEALCNEYGIRCFFVWQPELLTREWLSEEERRLAESLEEFRDVRLATYAAIRDDPWLRSKANFLYLADLFRDLRRQVYKTHCHFTRESRANYYVAQRLHRFVFEGIKDETPLPPDG